MNIARSVITTSAATGRSFLHVRRWLVSLIVGATLSFGFVTPALAAGGPPIGPVYDCYGYGTYAVITYEGALQLKSPTVYFTAPSRKGNSLLGTIVKGTYTLRATKLIFLTGTYGKIHWYGVWSPTRDKYGDQRHIGMYTPKGQEPLECYPWPH